MDELHKGKAFRMLSMNFKYYNVDLTKIKQLWEKKTNKKYVVVTKDPIIIKILEVFV